jgi:GR25 family glycosyltransferase involved in LPS biosynthesis
MKIEHAYILYMDDPKSQAWMNECVESAKEHNVPISPFLGFKLPVTVQEINDRWQVKVDAKLEWQQHENPVYQTWFKEQLCTSGHVAMWKEIVKHHNGAVACLEHDAYIVRSFDGIEVQDGEIVFLGFRVDQKEDYECLSDPFVNVPMKKFEGTHGYAITPNTAKYLLDILEKAPHLPVGVSVDHYLGVRNLFNLNMFVVDPAPLIAIIGDRVSFTQPENSVARYNMIPPEGFLKGIVKPEKYALDYQHNWIVF